MAQYIDKAALVAEIERRENESWNLLPNASDVIEDKYSKEDAIIIGEYNALESLEKFINTLEVKDVDLDTDFGVCWGEYCDCGGNINDYKIAKHFFELGLKTKQKGD